MADRCTFSCLCGKEFQYENTYGKHQRSCKSTKKRLSGALDKAREAWARKRQKFGHVDSTSNSVTNEPPVDILDRPPSIEPSSPQTHSHPIILQAALDDDSTSLAWRRPRREKISLPKRFRDILPQSAPSLPPAMPHSEPPFSSYNPPPELDNTAAVHIHNPSPPRSCIRRLFRTPRNIFGLVRQYFAEHLPSVDPEELVTLEDLTSPSSDDTSLRQPSSFYPFPNKSSFLLGDWYWNGGVQKSQQSFKDLIDIVGDPSFHPDNVRDTKWSEINATLGNSDIDGDAEWLDEDAGWKQRRVEIEVPFHSRMQTPGSRRYVVADLHHRSLVEVIKERVSDPHTGAQFHLEPYELLWKRSDQHKEVNIHGELYTSEAFREAHQALQDALPEPNCDLPRVVVGLMFWSDATHLTQFGNSQLWPCYVFIGNESKYRRCKPSCNLCSHVAYFQKLPDAFAHFAAQFTGGKGPKKPFLAFCRRECFHAQMEVLLDEEFLKAWNHGIVIKCFDGILRRFYPRIFTYSADYPEKVLLAGIKNRGVCLCPRCLIPKDRIQNLGRPQDRQQRVTLRRVDDHQRRFDIANARRLIYERNYAVDSKVLANFLNAKSWVPTLNAFSNRLQPLGFNLFEMLVVDLMHEFELGVWKALFIHLLRILLAVNAVSLHELDHRFRQIPTFGRDTIRRFRSSVSELKKMAARDFEDLLQCSIPVFDGLLPEPHNSMVQHLLFTCTHWHGLAKLRMHSDITLDILDEVTTSLGEAFRRFQREVCSAYDSKELPREANARRRRRWNENVTGKTKPSDDERLKKQFNLQTYKYHSLGDVVNTIRRFGTTDSYNTTTGELEHRRPKAWHLRTDRRRIVRQMTQLERRQARIRRIKQRLSSTGPPPEHVAADPNAHYHIGASQNRYQHIGTFLHENEGDPAIKDFLPKLKAHLLPRVEASLVQENYRSTEDTSVTGAVALPNVNASDLDKLLFKHDRMYQHNIMRINYTTYDVRRKQDSVNPATPHCDIMILANNENESEHPFLYARVIGIFHVNVVYTGGRVIDYRPRKFEVLWVRWFENDLNTAFAGSWSRSCLDRLCFPPMACDNAFGFLDPGDVVRGCHLIPAFAAEKRYRDGRGLSRCAMDSGDWRGYYVNRFVDRDMLMRYHWGLAIGHVYTHGYQCTNEGVNWPDIHERFRSADDPDEARGPPDQDQMTEELNQLDDLNLDSGGTDGSGSDSDDDDWVPSDSEDESQSSDDEHLADIDDMYGDGNSDDGYDG